MTNAPPKPRRSLAKIATIVAIATLISKVIGAARQMTTAAVFGVGPAVGAYGFAYAIPSFFLILLGGINGPFHSAIVGVLAKKERSEVKPVIETITTLLIGVLLLVTIGLIIFAEPILRLMASGLFISPEEAVRQGIDPATYAITQQTRLIAISQFKIMAPIALFSGLIGIGFGALNAADIYWMPSISPIFSSLAMMMGLGLFALHLEPEASSSAHALLGGQVLAWATLAGAVAQWLIQLPVQWRAGLGTLKPRWQWHHPDVRAVLKVLGPATFASGMLQINVQVDIFFSSLIPNATAAVSAWSYANFLVMAPLGILSNTILVPFFPVFSHLATSGQWDDLKSRIRQGIVMTAVAMLPLGAFMIALALPIVRLVYERSAFNAEASQLTASILIAYGLGMFVYLARDLLVRVFYALGDGNTPFRISLVSILFNILFDFLFVKPLGAPGLVLATIGVNVFSMVAMLWCLNKRLEGLNLKSWIQPLMGLTGASALSGLVAWGLWAGADTVWGSQGFLLLLINVSIAALGGFTVYGIAAKQLGILEVQVFLSRIRAKISFL